MKRAELALEDGADAAKLELHPKLESAKGGASGDIIRSLNISQEATAEARTMKDKLMALQLVKRDTQTTARHACQVLQAAEDELTEVESAEYKHLRRVYEAIGAELREAKTSLQEHLEQARVDAQSAAAAQEAALLPPHVVTQKILIVERAVRAARLSKIFVAALESRREQVEDEANNEHLNLYGEPMPEVKLRMQKEASGQDSHEPVSWATPELTAMKAKIRAGREGCGCAETAEGIAHRGRPWGRFGEQSPEGNSTQVWR